MADTGAATFDILMGAIEDPPPGSRIIVGVAGPPGSGKSTFSEKFVQYVNECRPSGLAVCLQMDGFHLSNGELRRRNLGGVKGKPETFDVYGFVNILHRIKESTGEIIYAPVYDRKLHEPIAGSTRVSPEVSLVVVEGNYLLYQASPWNLVRSYLDQCWYLDAPESLCRDRLIARQQQNGKTYTDAEAWFLKNDEPNIRLVTNSRAYADRFVEPIDLQ